MATTGGGVFKVTGETGAWIWGGGTNEPIREMAATVDAVASGEVVIVTHRPPGPPTTITTTTTTTTAVPPPTVPYVTHPSPDAPPVEVP